jgi:DNA repair protein RAD5
MSDSTFNESNLNIDRMIEKFMTNDDERKSSNYQIEILERLKHGDDFSYKECPICYDNLVNGVLMPCMHSACRQCIVDYFQVCEV